MKQVICSAHMSTVRNLIGFTIKVSEHLDTLPPAYPALLNKRRGANVSRIE